MLCGFQVSGISFGEDGKYFVTVGNRRVRYWYFDTTARDVKVGRKNIFSLIIIIIMDVMLSMFPTHP